MRVTAGQTGRPAEKCLCLERRVAAGVEAFDAGEHEEAYRLSCDGAEYSETASPDMDGDAEDQRRGLHRRLRGRKIRAVLCEGRDLAVQSLQNWYDQAQDAKPKAKRAASAAKHKTAE